LASPRSTPTFQKNSTPTNSRGDKSFDTLNLNP
jgi:hypothetical protein